MFERIKCYKNLKKMDAFAHDGKRIGELIQDVDMIRDANEILCKSAIIRKKILFNRKMAEKYNLEMIKNGY